MSESGQPQLRVGILMGICAFGASRGVPMPRLLAAAGVEPEVFADADAKVDGLGVLEVWRVLEEALPDQPLGLQLCEMVPPSAYGVLDHVSRTAATVRASIEAYQRYIHVVSTTAVTRLEVGPEVAWLWLDNHPSVERAGHPADFGLAHARRCFLRAGATVEDLVQVALGHRSFGGLQAYEAHFGCPVVANQPRSGIAFRTEALSRPNRASDPALSALLTGRLAELEGPPNGSGDIGSAVVRVAHGADYDAARIAKQLGMSLRTLQRRAREQGTTVRSLVGDARARHAQTLLRDRSLSVEDVAYLVGYAEMRSFNRAFQKTTGKTPARWRRQA